MTKKEFIKTCRESGYCDAKTAREYAENNPKDDYDSNDIIKAYHCVKNFAIKRHSK